MNPEKMILADGSEVTTIHFLFAIPQGHRIACMPGVTYFGAGGTTFRAAPILRTDEFRSVNCPLCKRTKQYTDAATHAAGAR
jgi:hypothetical protein